MQNGDLLNLLLRPFGLVALSGECGEAGMSTNVEPLSKNISKYDAGKYVLTAASWRNVCDGIQYEIGIRNKSTGEFFLCQSHKWDHQSVQEVANAMAMLLSDETQCYTPEWCQEFFT